MSGEISQLACPFCGRNRPIGHSGFSLKAMVIDPSEYGIITIRSVGPGPGRGHRGERGEGLRTIDRLDIREALEDPQSSEIAGAGERQAHKHNPKLSASRHYILE